MCQGPWNHLCVRGDGGAMPPRPVWTLSFSGTAPRSLEDHASLLGTSVASFPLFPRYLQSRSYHTGPCALQGGQGLVSTHPGPAALSSVCSQGRLQATHAETFHSDSQGQVLDEDTAQAWLEPCVKMEVTVAQRDKCQSEVIGATFLRSPIKTDHHLIRGGPSSPTKDEDCRVLSQRE